MRIAYAITGENVVLVRLIFDACKLACIEDQTQKINKTDSIREG